MVPVERSKAVLELGSRLASQLNADGDLLASWMAHYIAEMIEAAERAPAESKATAQEACAKAILELWRSRAALPEHLRPFAELEPVLRTLASLDVERTDHRYYPPTLRKAKTANADESTTQLLELAVGIDFTARLLIEAALRAAAHRAVAVGQPWVELAAQAGAEGGLEEPVIEWVLPDNEDGEAGGAADAALKARLSKLEAFVKLATSLAEDLRAELAARKVKEK
jgi:hypothetical protein